MSDLKCKPRAWILEPKVQRHPPRHVIRSVSAVEPTQEQRELADLDGDIYVPLYERLVGVDKSAEGDWLGVLLKTLRGIADADWRQWGGLASREEFVRWAKSRARHALAEYDRLIGDQVMVEDIGEVLTSLVGRFDAELLAMPESGLADTWHFKWEENASIEWNTYQFSDMLEMHKRSCQRWEEHHNGVSCVVERVRDKYLMPKVREFLAELATHSTTG